MDSARNNGQHQRNRRRNVRKHRGDLRPRTEGSSPREEVGYFCELRDQTKLTRAGRKIRKKEGIKEEGAVDGIVGEELPVQSKSRVLCLVLKIAEAALKANPRN